MLVRWDKCNVCFVLGVGNIFFFGFNINFVFRFSKYLYNGRYNCYDLF